ncbi:TIGR02680 family protein [Nocardioides humi]|uniref:TIGR02680 family protein n=1 Tax=Nocardioides humi TaxID=449461 RepID=A0ABN2A9U0_9ACTN|nr:TIGR02680 family protein [Nocardioides humi]
MTESTIEGTVLPKPSTERWQPQRLGLVDLFYYDDEQFWFHDGRLLLRGNNGTGKSKVLALTLPFLLDGSVLPRRVEPDADPKKRMEWNLLLGGAHPHSERTGYAWVEFGRREADGSERFLTLGIGLKAAAGRGIVKTWYFTTARRIGDLRLIDSTRTVLTAERLREEIDGAGQVYGTQEAYRRAVDEALFRLGEERYAALIDLLVQLRQPQLSKRPDEKALSAALTEALAPLDQAVVSDVAESFRSLEEERLGLADIKDTLGSAEVFLRHYRAYGQVATRRRTTALREANSRYEHVGRTLHRIEADLGTATAETERIAVALADADQEHEMLRGRERALRESPEMRDADRLHRADNAARDAENRAMDAERGAHDAGRRAEREAASYEDADVRSASTAAEARRRENAALALALEAGLAAEHPAIRSDGDRARDAIGRRTEQVRHVRGLLRAAAAAQARADQQRSALDDKESALTRTTEALAAADADVDAVVGKYRNAVRAFLRGLDVIGVEDETDELTEAAASWARALVDVSPVRRAVDHAGSVARERAGRLKAEAELAANGHDEQLRALEDRIAELESGQDPAPTAAPGRDQRARAGVPGAPLWQLVDFAAGLSPTDQAGLEAALQSAGLLDAWVFDDGRVEADGDVVLGAGGARCEHAHLGQALTPAVAPDSGVADVVVADVLSRIGLGEDAGAHLWVDLGGRWGAGPARGSWHKQQAEHVGAGAREAHRRDLIARLRAEAEQVAAELAAARARVIEADRRLNDITAELASYPADVEQDLIAAHARDAAARRVVEQAQADVTMARAVTERRSVEAAEADGRLREAGTALDLGTTEELLDRTGAAVADYREALAELRNALTAAAEAERAREAARTRAAEAAQGRDEADAAARAHRSEAASLRAEAEALQATVGATVAQLQAELAATAQGLKEVVETQSRLREARVTAATNSARLEQQLVDLTEQREQESTARATVVESLRVFVGTGLLRVALPELDTPDVADPDAWTVTASVGLARTAEQQLGDVDESADGWNAVQQRLSGAANELASQMSRHGHTALLEPHDDVLISRVRYRGDEVDIDRLAERLAGDVAERERLLSAKEREILENHLVNEVAGHLHELLLAADRQLDRMNRELAERKTSTGMQLRVRWRERADGPVGLGAARELMLRSDATWSAKDREAIGGFLQARIAEIRQADPTGGWQEHLEQALDYRQWHTFAVERWQHGSWRSASGPASGGEKVLAVSVPLFAAAASHYNSADPHAPRLILLDEAFAGVDDDSRAKSLGLLATFDLDVVMTSEREWGCYPEVPGLSIAQLSRIEGVDAVGVTRWRWDGRARRRDNDVDADARATALTTAAATGQDGDSLFG